MLVKSGALIQSLLKRHRTGMKGLNDGGPLFEHGFLALL